MKNFPTYLRCQLLALLILLPFFLQTGQFATTRCAEASEKTDFAICNCYVKAGLPCPL